MAGKVFLGIPDTTGMLIVFCIFPKACFAFIHRPAGASANQISSH